MYVQCDCFECAVDGDDHCIALERVRMRVRAHVLCNHKKNENIFIAHFKLAFILGVSLF